jgi:cyclopropane-fatty-acyl-phospholipid synthase
MNESAIIDQTLRETSARSPGVFQHFVMRALERMDKGCLELTLPDGSQRVIGRRDAAICAKMQIVRPSFFKRCALFGDVGFGESYVDGDWETDSIERVVAWAIHNIDKTPEMKGSATGAIGLNLLKMWNRALHLLRPNSVKIARENIAEHYDLGNDFYRLWLDETMTYSSGIFSSNDQSLEESQFAKYDVLCQKARLQASDRVLEIGCGWGGFSLHAAKHYGCHVTAVTISQEQFRFARERFAREGVADRTTVLLQDYRLIEGQFDKIVSIEMMEALGDQYLETFCAKLHRLLKPDGIVALQYITIPDSRHTDLKRGVDWIQKHIFPGSLLLSIGRVSEVLTHTGDLFLHNLQDFGFSYAKTLNLWWRNFNACLPEVHQLGFDERFVRKWNYYLQYCEAAFSMRNISVVHAIYTRPNNANL